MTPEYPTDPREALAASLTALILGELPPDQARFLREALIRDAQLASIHERLKQTIDLVRKVEAPISGAQQRDANVTDNVESRKSPPEPLKLSESKREQLLAHFKTTPMPSQSTYEEAASRRSSWWLTAAAAVVFCFLGLAMLLPALTKAKSKAQSVAFKYALPIPGSSSATLDNSDSPRPAKQPVRGELAAVDRRLSSVSSGVADPQMLYSRQSSPIVLPQSAEDRKGNEELEAGRRTEAEAAATLSTGDAFFKNAGDQAAKEARGVNAGVALLTPPPASMPVPVEARVRTGGSPKRQDAGAVAGGFGGGVPLSSPTPLAQAQSPERDRSTDGAQASFRRRYGLAREPTQPPDSVSKGERFATANRTESTAPAAKTDTQYAWAEPTVKLDAPAHDYKNDVSVLLVSPTNPNPVLLINRGNPNTGLTNPANLQANEWSASTTVRGYFDQKDAAQSSERVPILGDKPALGTELALGKNREAVSRDYFAGRFSLSAGDKTEKQILRNQAGVSDESQVHAKLNFGGAANVSNSPGGEQKLEERGRSLGFFLSDAETPVVSRDVDALSETAEKFKLNEQLSEAVTLDSVYDTAKKPASEKGVAAVGERSTNFASANQASTDAAGRYKRAVALVDGLQKREQELLLSFTSSNTIVKSLEARLSAAKAEKQQLESAHPELLGRPAGPAQQAAADVAPAKPVTPPPVPQPEVQTADNAFSTFSLNVSDVSFKLAAASLEKGAMPDPAGIRSEEFINAFDYRDPEAAAGMPLAFAWERARYSFAQNRDLLRFSVKTAAQGRQAGRPLNLVLLVDNSGSMERADRVYILREALRVLATQLQPQDKLSVISFSRTPHLWVDGVSGNEAARVAEEIAGLTPQGGTNLEEAMKLAYKTAARHYLATGINRVVMLTDGAANLGDVNPAVLKKSVEDHRKQGIALDCFGIGWEGYNDDLLEVLSRNGDGRYGFINTPEEATTEFAGKLAGALHVAASDVKVQVEFNPARVTAYRQIGYAKHQLTKEQFRDNTVDAAELAAAEAGNALYVIEVNPQGEGPLATVRARYKVPGTGEYHEHEWAVPYNGNAPALEQSSPAMRLAAAASAFSEWLSSSPYAAGVTPDGLLNVIRGVPQIYGADTRPQKLEWMVQQARSIAGK